MVEERERLNQQKISSINQIDKENLCDIVFLTAQAIILVLDNEGRVVDVNPVIESITGFTKEEIVGKIWIDFIPKKEKDDVKKVLDQSINKGVVKFYRNSVATKDGKEVIIDWVNSELHDHNGLLGLLAMGTDVTEQVKTQEALKNRERRDRQNDKMKAIGTLAGGIAHEFNNILAGTLGSMELAKMNLKDKHGKASKHIENGIAGIFRATNLVKQLLTFARKSPENHESLSLDSVIKKAILFLLQAVSKNIKIKYSNNASNSVILGNDNELQHVIINLCNNAAVAMNNKGVIKVDLNDFEPNEYQIDQMDIEKGEYVEIVVSDTGVGINNEDLERIFEPYFTTKAVGKGTGLGLSIVHGIIKSHNGKIFVESEVDKGTTFRIIFPKSKIIIKEKEVNKKIETPKGSETVLLIDDEEAIMNTSALMLKTLNYKVIACQSGEEAMEIIKNQRSKIDLVLTDMTMPGMDGEDVVRNTKKIDANLPVIMCSGYTDEDNIDDFKKIGAKAFLGKPFYLKELASLIRKVLDEAKKEKEKNK